MFVFLNIRSVSCLLEMAQARRVKVRLLGVVWVAVLVNDCLALHGADVVVVVLFVA